MDLKRLFKPRIQNKFIIAFLFVGLFPMITATYVAVKKISSDLEKEIIERIESASRLTAGKIERYKNISAWVAGQLADNPEVKQAVAEPNEVKAIQALTRIAMPYRESFGTEWVLREREKKVAGTVQTLMVFQLGLATGEGTSEKETTIFAGAITPVAEGGQVLGYLVVGNSLGDKFRREVEDAFGVNVAIWYNVKMLAESKSGTAGPGDEVQKLKGLRLSSRIRKIVFEENKPYFDRDALYNDIPHLARYEPLVSSNNENVGMLFIGIPKQYSFASAVGSEQFFLIIIIPGVVMAAGFGYAISRSISRPIKQLAKSAIAVAEGNLDVRLDVKTRDEIGRLSEAFNTMVEKLRTMKTLEEQLRRTERLNALGELSAGMAHELRNPLGIIKGSAEMLKKKLTGGTDARELLEYIIGETNRLNKITTDFLEFARPQELSLETADINETIERTLSLAKHELEKNGIRLKKEFEEGLPQLLIDTKQLYQVFLNLTINAIQAMPGGGRLSVSTRLVSGGGDEGDRVRIVFSDTGTGVDEGAREKIFNPFFTTKDKGSGLGLAVAHRIVESHHGRISIEGGESPGATFVVELPVGRGAESQP